MLSHWYFGGRSQRSAELYGMCGVFLLLALLFCLFLESDKKIRELHLLAAGKLVWY